MKSTMGICAWTMYAVSICAACGGDGGNHQNNNDTHLLNNNNNLNNNNSSLGTLGNPCDNGVCHDESVCLQGLCTAAGNPGEPCFSDGTCLAGYSCHADLCYDSGEQGEACLPDGTCNVGLSCHENVCYLAGNTEEPCFPDNSCNEGFACANASVEGPQQCRPAILGRIVNCLASGGQSIGMRLVVGMVEFPEISSMYSTTCLPIPTGGVGITMYIDGEWYEDAFMQIPAGEPEVYIQPTATAFNMYVAACDAQLQCQ